MQIIKFRKNQKETWNEFIAENNSEGFLQSWEWGDFQKSLGHKIWRIGIIEDSKFQIPNSKFYLMALIVKYNLPFGRSYLYCPRGPVVNESKVYKVTKLKVLKVLFNEIKKISKEERSLFLKIDPAMDWNIEYRILNMEDSYFKKSPSEVQPKNTLILDITKSEDELLKEMKQKTRYNIRLAGKKELRIRSYELGMDNKKIFEEKFEEFWKLVKETSERDKFSSHSKNYYWQMLESLAMTDATTPRPSFAKEGSTDNVPCSNLQAKLYLAEYDGKTIAANIVLYFGDMAVYLHGASSNEYRNLMAPYLLQWQQILDAKKAGCKKYDFWGIAPKFQIPNSKSQINSKFQIPNSKLNSWGGITRFKKGFGGEEKNYIGAYDLIFDNIGYRIYESMKFIKSKVVKFIK